MRGRRHSAVLVLFAPGVEEPSDPQATTVVVTERAHTMRSHAGQPAFPGGGTERVRIGERCLVGAEAGVGIALGDDCVVEAGLYVTAGTKVTLADGRVVKARELSGVSNLLFLRNSTTGTVEARSRTGQGIELNAALHAND